MSVARSDNDKDADENEDADQKRTGRPVSGQPPGLFTQCEDIDINFRVSGLPHAVVKQAENFSVRELVKKIESHEESKKLIRDMGNVELFELCETIPKVQSDHDWTRGNDELGSTVEQQPVGKLVQQSCGEVQQATFSQLTQPKPKPICDRLGKPEDTQGVFVVKGDTSRSHEIDEKGLHEKTLCFRWIRATC